MEPNKAYYVVKMLYSYSIKNSFNNIVVKYGDQTKHRISIHRRTMLSIFDDFNIRCIVIRWTVEGP